MKTKPIITVCLVAFILASCVPATKVVPTVTAFPTSTFTPNPTKTLKPTEAPTATVTKDPNEPVGATGHDEKGYYKEADGVKYYATEFVDAKGEIIWVSNHTIGTIYLMPQTEHITARFPIEFFVKSGVSGVPNIRVNPTHELPKPMVDSYELNLFRVFEERCLGKSVRELAKTPEGIEIHHNFVNMFNNDGTLPISINTSTGEHTILLKNLKIRVILVSPGDVPSPDLTISKLNFESQIIFSEDNPNEVIILESMSTFKLTVSFFPIWLLLSSPKEQSFELFMSSTSTLGNLRNLSIDGENQYFITSQP